MFFLWLSKVATDHISVLGNPQRTMASFTGVCCQQTECEEGKMLTVTSASSSDQVTDTFHCGFVPYYVNDLMSGQVQREFSAVKEQLR